MAERDAHLIRLREAEHTIVRMQSQLEASDAAARGGMICSDCKFNLVTR